MSKKMTRKNAPLVLARLAVFVASNPEQAAYVVEAMNETLDGLVDMDVFGTEAQNDPRGDQR